MSRKYRILCFFADQGGCQYYRISQIAKYIEKKYPDKFKVETSMLMNRMDWMTQQKDDPNKIIFRNFDLIISQRQYGAANLENAKFIKETLHIPQIYEIDDYLHGVSPMSSAYFAYNNTHKERFKNIEDYMKTVDAITVTTPRLQKEYSRFNENAYILPNAMEISNWDGIEKVDNGNDIIIGYAGSSTHFMDLKQAEDAIRQILKEYPNVKLGLGGWHVKDKNGNRMMFRDIPDNKIVEYPWVRDMTSYAKMLSNFDIGIAPLESTIFNECKSSIKFFEMSLSGAAVVASDWGPYKVIEHGVDGFLAKTNGKVFESWYKSLKRLIEDEKLRKSFNEKAKEKVKRDHNIENEIDKWAECWENIILKKEIDLAKSNQYNLRMLPESEWTWRTKEQEKEIYDGFVKRGEVEDVERLQ